MARVVFTEPAEYDLLDIEYYIFVDLCNPQAAQRISDGILGAAGKLAEYMSNIFTIHNVEPFEVKIFNSRVSMRSEREKFSIDIIGRKSSQKLYELLIDIESLLFFYMVFFPLIIFLKVNGEDADIFGRVGKYHTSSIFTKQNLVICDISANTVTEQKLLHFKQMNQMALFSLQFLVSENYERAKIGFGDDLGIFSGMEGGKAVGRDSQ